MLEFKLLYQGQLLGASRDDKRPHHKHELRKEFHKQLKRLWTTKSPLKERTLSNIPRALDAAYYSKPEDAFISYSKTVADKFTYHGYSFLPVISDELFLTCSIEILFLRPEESRMIFQMGDIDGRIKTIFDSLRMPSVQEASQLKNEFPPTDDEKPMYCLLEDDKLISEVRLATDQLLLLPGTSELKATDSFLVITVKVKPTRLCYGNLDFA